MHRTALNLTKAELDEEVKGNTHRRRGFSSGQSGRAGGVKRLREAEWK